LEQRRVAALLANTQSLFVRERPEAARLAVLRAQLVLIGSGRASYAGCLLSLVLIFSRGASCSDSAAVTAGSTSGAYLAGCPGFSIVVAPGCMESRVCACYALCFPEVVLKRADVAAPLARPLLRFVLVLSWLTFILAMGSFWTLHANLAAALGIVVLAIAERRVLLFTAFVFVTEVEAGIGAYTCLASLAVAAALAFRLSCFVRVLALGTVDTRGSAHVTLGLSDGTPLARPTALGVGVGSFIAEIADRASL